MGKPESGKAGKRASGLIDYKLLVSVTQGSGDSRKATFTFFEHDIKRLQTLADRFNVNKSVMLRYLIADLHRLVNLQSKADRLIDEAKRFQ